MQYICEGTIVTNKNKNRYGVVAIVDPETKVAMMRTKTGYWADLVKNLTVVSYKEVK